MYAGMGDRPVTHRWLVSTSDRFPQVIADLGADGAPLHRVRDRDGHELFVRRGPDTQVEHVPTDDPRSQSAAPAAVRTPRVWQVPTARHW